MNNFPRQILRQIVDKYGKEICSDARRCKSLLNDFCGACRRETNILVDAIEERVPLDLLAGAASMPAELLLNRLEKRLEENTGLTAQAARWAVESWALALGVASDAEIEERARKQSNSPSAKAETSPSTELENKSRNQEVSSSFGTAPPPKSKPSPTNQQPTAIPHASPPVILPQKTHPPFQVPNPIPQPQSTNPIVVSKGCLGGFRGCLVMAFFLAVASVVLFLGVPYVIEVMRETQRERNNEPPRFPTR